MVTYPRTVSAGTNVEIWFAIAFIIAIIGGVIAYALFVKGSDKRAGFLGWLHKFLNFKVLVVEDVIKITYIILAIFITLGSFGLIATNIISFFLVLILGNLLLRITYEISILLVKICQNTTEINNKLKK